MDSNQNHEKEFRIIDRYTTRLWFVKEDKIEKGRLI
jgi:hypothetical protein